MADRPDFSNARPGDPVAKEETTAKPGSCRVLKFTDARGKKKSLIVPNALDVDSPKKPRFTFSAEQLEILERVFQQQRYLKVAERPLLAKTLKVTQTQVPSGSRVLFMENIGVADLINFSVEANPCVNPLQQKYFANNEPEAVVNCNGDAKGDGPEPRSSDVLISFSPHSLDFLQVTSSADLATEDVDSRRSSLFTKFDPLAAARPGQQETQQAIVEETETCPNDTAEHLVDQLINLTLENGAAEALAENGNTEKTDSDVASDESEEKTLTGSDLEQWSSPFDCRRQTVYETANEDQIRPFVFEEQNIALPEDYAEEPEAEVQQLTPTFLQPGDLMCNFSTEESPPMEIEVEALKKELDELKSDEIKIKAEIEDLDNRMQACDEEVSRLEAERRKIMEEKAQYESATKNLAALYDKLDKVSIQFEENDKIMAEAVVNGKTVVKRALRRYDVVKNYCFQTLEKARQETEQFKQENEAKISALKLSIKKSELENAALLEEIERLDEDIRKMSGFLDEYIGKNSKQNEK